MRPAPAGGEAHRAVPRRLLELHERANSAGLDGEGIQAWLEWEWEAVRWRVPVDVSATELRELIERESHGTLPGSEGQPR